MTCSAKLQPHQLTFIAEDLGRRDPAPICRLLLLSRHPSEVVREGAVYGLAPHHDRADVGSRLMMMRDEDPDPHVRRAAEEAIEP